MHNTLLVLFLSIFYVDLMSHQGTMAFQDRGELGLFVSGFRPIKLALGLLPIYQIGGTLAGVAFLVLYGLQTHWYMPVAAIAVGSLGRLILLRLEMMLGLFNLERRFAFITLIGLAGLPIVLFLLFNLGNIRP